MLPRSVGNLLHTRKHPVKVGSHRLGGGFRTERHSLRYTFTDPSRRDTEVGEPYMLKSTWCFLLYVQDDNHDQVDYTWDPSAELVEVTLYSLKVSISVSPFATHQRHRR